MSLLLQALLMPFFDRPGLARLVHPDQYVSVEYLAMFSCKGALGNSNTPNVTLLAYRRQGGREAA